MAGELVQWAVAERQFVKDEITWFKAGAKLISPSGDDISSKKLAELQARLEHVGIALEAQDDA